MALAVWFYQFENRGNVEWLRGQEKEQIVERYLNSMESLFNARAEASFGNEVSYTDIDNFMLGFGDNKGYIARLQEAADKYYSDSFRNAKELFNFKINKQLEDFIAKGHCSVDSLNKNQQRYFNILMERQQIILDAMSQLISLAESYALAALGVGNTKVARAKLASGMYDLQENSVEGQEALKLYNKVKQVNASLQAAKVDASNITQNFSCFAKTADAFHADYGEILLTVLADKINREDAKVKKGISSAWTGMKQYTVGQGDLSVSFHLIEDVKMKENLNIDSSSLEYGSLTGTATNDSSISASINGVVGIWGGTVKEYSEKTVKRFKGWTGISDFENIYTAAGLAVQYGLPVYAASKDYIANLGGALYGAYGAEGLPQQLWNEYLQTLTTLMTLDALMGRMKSMSISSNANNFVFWKNGRVYYMKDLIKNFVQGGGKGVKSLPSSKWWSVNKEGNQWDRNDIEQAHWEVWEKHGTGSEAAEAISTELAKIRIKIQINMNNLLGLT